MLLKQTFVRGVVVMRILIALIISLVLWYNFNIQESFAYSTNQFYTVYVESGDSVWSIARRHIQANEDIREVVYQIRTANNLGVSATVFPGQPLLIPVKIYR